MKKIITLLFAFGLLLSFVSASAPPVPMPVIFEFLYQGQPIQNFQVRFTIGTETITRLTNNLGKVGMDVGTGSADFPSSNPWTDTLIVDCGFSVCNVQYVINTLDSPYQGTFTLAEQPPTTCPPTNCPDCNCGGGGGGVYCSEAELEDKCPAYCEETPCSITRCQDIVCEDPISCPTTDCSTCPPTDCPDTPVCQDTVCPEDNVGAELIVGLVALIIGAGGMYYLKKGQTNVKGTGIKIYTNRNGERIRQHRHPGIRGYHDPLTLHRVKKEQHPKGELDPEYEKDEDDEWKYVG